MQSLNILRLILFLEPLANCPVRVTPVKMPNPRISRLVTAIFQIYLRSGPTIDSRVSGGNSIRGYISSNQTAGADKRTFADSHSRKNDAHRCDHCEFAYFYAQPHFARRVRIVGQNYIWKYPHEIFDDRFLTYMNVTVKLHITAD